MNPRKISNNLIKKTKFNKGWSYDKGFEVRSNIQKSVFKVKMFVKKYT